MLLIKTTVSICLRKWLLLNWKDRPCLAPSLLVGVLTSWSELSRHPYVSLGLALSVSLWASGHALACHMRSCGSADGMNSGAGAQPAMGPWSALSSSFILSESLPLKLLSPSPSHLHFSRLCFFPFISSLHSSLKIKALAPLLLPPSHYGMNSFLCQVDPHS